MWWVCKLQCQCSAVQMQAASKVQCCEMLMFCWLGWQSFGLTETETDWSGPGVPRCLVDPSIPDRSFLQSQQLSPSHCKSAAAGCRRLLEWK